tara:strand:- start:121 stop:426 length:306 start_codon:yes stop_codon:yes gene_type:complete
MEIIKKGRKTNDMLICLILLKMSGVKFDPTTQPSKARNNGSGFFGIFISTLHAQKKPIINKGPSIQGRGIPIFLAQKPPTIPKVILRKYFKLIYANLNMVL